MMARQPIRTANWMCCPAPPSGKPVVNADQTVILIWDADTKTEHFIRKASFQSEADDFGFLVPTPTQPELAESGNEAFPLLLKLTEPETKKERRIVSRVRCARALQKLFVIFRLIFCPLGLNRGGSSLRCRHNIRRLKVCKSRRRISRRLRGSGRLCVKNYSLFGK